MFTYIVRKMAAKVHVGAQEICDGETILDVLDIAETFVVKFEFP